MRTFAETIDHFVNLAVKMLRIRTFAMLTMFLLIFHTSLYGDQYNYEVLLQLLVLAAWYVHATCVNDIADYEIDKINLKGNKERPLANNLISKKDLSRLTYVAVCVAVASSLYLGVPEFLATMIVLLLNYIYSMPPAHVSYRGVLAPLMLPLGYIGLPWALVHLGDATRLLEPQSLILLAGFYFGFVGRIVLKDLRDIKGDSKFGKRTFVVRYGRTATTIFSAAFWGIGSLLLSMYCIKLGSYSEALLISVVTFFVWYVLSQISSENSVKKQLRLVAALGRSANTACILVLLAITVAGTETHILHLPVVNLFLAVTIAAFGLLSARDLYADTSAAA